MKELYNFSQLEFFKCVPRNDCVSRYVFVRAIQALPTHQGAAKGLFTHARGGRALTTRQRSVVLPFTRCTSTALELLTAVLIDEVENGRLASSMRPGATC
ncbi:hypothetical protein EVAR_78937_1 [Eumeta japonica]|uniref:Uncharacterized protein n=1 Tax=Eumeta variegata TaxID=151549 RepID=A0A4C1U2S7_EUMVA|nr:hypothetical protein EVAR_78937_1 [Eumeta japonica]